jgi:hypothetical protein
MTWTKLGDEFSDESWRLSDAAWRLHVEGLIWSNRKLLDLRLPKDEMNRWAKRPEAAPELLAIGWWTDEGDYYRIHHHGVHQPTAEEAIARQEASRSNGRKGGRPPKKKPPAQNPDENQLGSGARPPKGKTPAENPNENQLGSAGTKPSENLDGRGGSGRAWRGEVVKPDDISQNGEPCAKCGNQPAQQSASAWQPELCKECSDGLRHPSMRGAASW